MSFNYPWKITIPPLEIPRPRGDLVRTLADGYSTVGLGFNSAELYIKKLRQLNEELQQLRLEILSLLAETPILMENFLKTTKTKELSRSQKMGDLVLSIGSNYNKYDQDDFESNNTVSYNDPEQDSRSNATLNSKDKDSYGVQREVDSSGAEEDSNEIQKDSNGVQKEVDSSGVEEDSNVIQKDSYGDQESPRRSSRVMKNASPYLPNPLWSTIPFYGAVSSLVVNLDKQIHGTDVLISLLQREKTYETRMEIVNLSFSLAQLLDEEDDLLANLSFSLAQLLDEEDDLLAQVENSGYC